jgi:hypothetical protein
MEIKKKLENCFRILFVKRPVNYTYMKDPGVCVAFCGSSIQGLLAYIHEKKHRESAKL